MNSRGAMFTIVSVVLLGVIATMFFTQARVGIYDTQRAAADRVLAINGFITNLEKDTQRAAYISGFRALIAMEQEVSSNGAYLTDPEDAFSEAFLTGNISGTEFQVMLNSSFEEYLSRAQYEARKQGIQFNVSVANLALWQADPWNLLVNYTLDMNVTDIRGTAEWSLQKSFVGEIPLEDLRDPLFAAETLGKIQRVIRKTPVVEYVDDVGDANDTTNLFDHFNYSYYAANGRGPSVLMRFSGNMSDSPFGIESLVDTEDLAAQGLTIYSSRTVVDYKYFEGDDADACNIQNMPLHFKLDTASLDDYEVQGELDYLVC